GAVDLTDAEVIATHQRQDVAVIGRHRHHGTLQVRDLAQAPCSGRLLYPYHIPNLDDFCRVLRAGPGVAAVDEGGGPAQAVPVNVCATAIAQQHLDASLGDFGNDGRVLVAQQGA